MLKWYKKLYIGDNAKKKASSIIRKINHKKVVPGVYLVTLASNPENLLEIISADQLLQPALRKLCPPIVGLAFGYEEAVDMIKEIVIQTYRDQKDTDVRGYLEQRNNEKSCR